MNTQTVLYGQLVVGPPGSGKSTYCKGMQDFFETVGRPVELVNLDPANDDPPYNCTIDIRDLIEVTDVMDEINLGPNGSLVYCIEFLEENIDWLTEQIKNRVEKRKVEMNQLGNDIKERGPPYFIFDLPGQVELYTHYKSVKQIVEKLQKVLDFRVAVVHLVESIHCSTGNSLVSSIFVSLAAMMRLELPHVNVMSKIDIVEEDSPLAFAFENNEDGLDASYLMSYMGVGEDAEDNPGKSDSSSVFLQRNNKMVNALSDMLDDYGLVSFIPLNIQDKFSVVRVVKVVDKCNGYHHVAEHAMVAQ